MARDDELINELMPNAGEVAAPGVFVEPEQTDEQQDEQDHEKTVMASLDPIAEELMEWFGEQIQACDSIEMAHKALKLYAHMNPKPTVEQILIAHDIVRTLLESKQGDLSSRLDNWRGRNDDDDSEDESDEPDEEV